MYHVIAAFTIKKQLEHTLKALVQVEPRALPNRAISHNTKLRDIALNRGISHNAELRYFAKCEIAQYRTVPGAATGGKQACGTAMWDT